MKKTKIISGLMALAMSASMMAVTASAAETVKVTIGNDKTEAGGSFSIDVDLASLPSSGLTTVDFAISYDKSLVSITDVSLGSIGKTGADSKEGEYGDTLFNVKDTGSEIIIVWATGVDDSAYWLKKEGTFVTITGKASSNAPSGSVAKFEGKAVDRLQYPGGSANKDIVFSSVDADKKVTDYEASVTAGSVEIGKSVEAKYGDVDCNGQIDVKDAVLLARISANDSTLTSDEASAQAKINADVTHDGVVTAKDLTKLLCYLAYQISEADLAVAS